MTTLRILIEDDAGELIADAQVRFTHPLDLEKCLESALDQCRNAFADVPPYPLRVVRAKKNED